MNADASSAALSSFLHLSWLKLDNSGKVGKSLSYFWVAALAT